MKRLTIALIFALFVLTTPGFAQKLIKINTGLPEGTWWRNQNYVSMLSLTTDQQKKMDEVFQQSRIKLIDLNAALDKEEAILEPMMEADRLDEGKVAAQIDKVADARAALEKANARMLLGIRQVLTPEQWSMLNVSNKWIGGPGWTVAKPKKQ
jgi:Spy/CpxP family protein refolding chaperone